MTNEEAHRFAREKGVSRRLYALVRAIVAPFLRLYFRMHISGAEHLPATGAAIIAPNHKSASGRAGRGRLCSVRIPGVGRCPD